MRILLVNTGLIPVQLYGGTQRVVWGLGKELVKLGHEVTYLVKKGSYSDFASVIYIDESLNVFVLPERVCITEITRIINIHVQKYPRYPQIHKISR